MSIDAINISVKAIDSLKHELPDERRRREAAQLAAEHPPETAPQAAVVTISDEALAEHRDGAAVQEAVEALFEASRENLAVTAEAVDVAHDHAAVLDESARDAAAAEERKQAAIDAATSTGVTLVVHGGLPSANTGDPPLRQPGLSVFA